MSKKHKGKRVAALSRQEKRMIATDIFNTWAAREDNHPLLERAEAIVNTLLYLDSVPTKGKK